MSRASRTVRRSRRRALVAAAGAVLALLAGGCSDDDGAPATPAGARAEPLGEQVGGSVAQLAQCADWTGGSQERKLATVADIRDQVNRTDTGIDAPPLTDDEALALFDRACEPPYAKGFRLYVIYARAAGFGPLARDAG